MSDSFHQISDHLWVQQSKLFSTNCGVFYDDARAALIDPGILPEEIEEIMRFLSGKKVRAEFILLTHAHWDHVLGAASFPGAKIITHRAYWDEVNGEAGERLRQRAERFYQENGLKLAGRFQIPHPEISFNETLTITVGRERLRLISAAGHMASQMAVTHAESGMLWAGDMMSDLEIPLTGQSLVAYEKTLERFAALNIRALVPGHGTATNDPMEIRKRLEHDRKYVTGLRERVQRMVKARMPLEKTVEACQDVPFRDPLENAGDHLNNVEKAYLELGGAAV